MNRWFKHHQAIGRRKHSRYLDIYKSDKLTGHQTPGSSENNWRLGSARSGVIVISTPSTGHSILGGRYSVTISQHHDLSPDCHARAFVFVGRLFRSVRGEGRCPHDTRWCWQAALSGASLRHRHVTVKISTRLRPQKYMRQMDLWTLFPAFRPYPLHPRSSNRILQRTKVELDSIKHRPWWLTLGRSADSRAAPVLVTQLSRLATVSHWSHNFSMLNLLLGLISLITRDDSLAAAPLQPTLPTWCKSSEIIAGLALGQVAGGSR